MSGVKRSAMRGQNDANITPLADVTTTLIVVFLITMPAILGNGIQVNATRAEASATVVSTSADQKDELVMVSVTTDGLFLNGDPVESADLEGALRDNLSGRIEKTVVIIPSDFVKLDEVVFVLDAAKAGGAKSLALLNKREEGAR